MANTDENRLEIIIEIDGVSYYMDTDGSTSIPINYQIADINDIASRKASYSLSIDVPETPNNRFIFNSISDLSVDLTRFNPNWKAPVVVLSDSFQIFKGNLQLKSVKMDLDKDEYRYSCTIYSENDDFFKNVGDSLLSDLDFSELNHTWLASAVTASWYDNWESGYYYPMIDTSYIPDLTYINGSFTISHRNLLGQTSSFDSQLFITDFQPATYIKYIWDKIFRAAGYSYNSNFLEGDIFKNIVLPFTSKALFQDLDFIDTLKFIVGKNSNQILLTQSTANTTYGPPPNINYIGEQGYYNFSAINFTDINTPFNNVNNLWNVSGSYFTQPDTVSDQKFDINIDVDYYLPLSEFLYTPQASFNLMTDLSLVVVRSRDPDTGATVSNWSQTPTISQLISYPKVPFPGGNFLYSLRMDTPTALSCGGISTTTQIGVDGSGNPKMNTKLQIYTDDLNNRPDVVMPWITLSYKMLYPGEQVRVFLVNYGGLFLMPGGQLFSPLTDLTIYGGAGLAFSSWTASTINATPESHFANLISTTLIPGQPVDYNQIMPINVKQKDFLTSIIKMFNLYIEPTNEYPNTLNIEPRDDYYASGEFKDWTTKLDISKPISSNILALTQNKSTLFTYKTDSDYYNTDYFSRLKRLYGDIRFTIDNEFIVGEKKIENIFSPTPLNLLSGSEKLVYPSIFKLNNGKLAASDTARNGNYSNYRILFRNPEGLISLPDSDKWIFEGVTQSSYPYVGHFYPDPYEPTEDLNWGQSYLYFENTPTFNNLYYRYWKNTMDEISDINSRIITAEFYLTPEDIYNFKFNDNIYLVVNGAGNYYKVNKISNYDPTQTKTTTVELLKSLDVTVPILQGTDQPTTTSIHLPTNGISGSIKNISIFDRGNVVSGVGNINTGVFNNITGSGVVMTGNGNVSSSFGGLIMGSNNVDNNLYGSLLVGRSNMSSGGFSKFIFGNNNNDLSSSSLMMFGNNNYTSTNSRRIYTFGDYNILVGTSSGQTNSIWVSNSTTFGSYNTIEGSNTFIVGTGNTGSQGSYIFGNNNSGATGSYIFGNDIDGTYSDTMYINLPIVLGPSGSITGATAITGTPNTMAYYDGAGAIGSIFTILEGPTYSLAEGFGNDAPGLYSHAEGLLTISSGTSSHAEGSTTTALGDNSHAEGYNTVANDLASHAEGNLTQAVGIASHAEGNQTQATGIFSHAEGNSTLASGNDSHAEGTSTIASGLSSHAEGDNTQATGNFSHSEGSGNIASGTYSHAEGASTTSSGDASHAEGSQTVASADSSHAEGSATTASGIQSHSEGLITTASGIASHAEGTGTTASGDSSHAEGYETVAATYSHSEGYRSVASGQGAHAEGTLTKSSGDYSHSEGRVTIASGLSSHAEGDTTVASGTYSHSEGFGTTASGQYSHAGGWFTVAQGEFSSSRGKNTEVYGIGSDVSGNDNTVSASYSSIVGGSGNLLNNSTNSAIIGGVGLTLSNATSIVLVPDLRISNIDQYTNNTAAVAAGLTAGDIYKLPVATDIAALAIVF